jgi:PAS domain S-box-containing protein
MTLIDQAARNSSALANVEAQAYEARRAGDFSRAARLVYGEEYSAALDGIKRAADAGLTRIESRLTLVTKDLTKGSRLASSIAIVATVLNTISILLALALYQRRVLKPVLRLSRETQLLSEGKQTQAGKDDETSELGVLAWAVGDYRNQQAASVQLRAEHQRAENELAESRMLMQALLDQIPAVVYAKDIEGRYILVNQVWCELAGVRMEGALGATDRDLMLNGDDGGQFPPNELMALMSGVVVEREESIRQPDGRDRVYMSYKFPIRDVRGNIFAVGGVSSDITQSKTAELAAREAREVAEDATRTKAEFLARMSHEIRTPLNAIIGFTHLTLRTSLTARQRDYVRKIERSGDNLLSIINDVLDFSKIEAGKFAVKNIKFDLSDVMDEVSSQMAAMAHSKELEFVVNLPSNIPISLIGDPFRLGQILRNYIGNAIKFTEKGEVIVAVQTVERSDVGLYLRFSVRDTGIGIAEDQVARVFQGFAQADVAVAQKYGGTGLGLAISKELAELMGGQVGVESVAGVGSVFWFTARFSAVGATAGCARQLPSVLHGQSILIVDNHPLTCAVLVEQLTAMGFSARAVESGEAALTEIGHAKEAGRPYAIVLVDVRMPGISGVEVTRRIRNLEHVEPPYLLLLGEYGDALVDDMRTDDCDVSILMKPVSGPRLLDTLVQLLEGKQLEGLPSEAVSMTPETGLAIRPSRVLLVEDNVLNQEVVGEMLRDAGVIVDIAENGLTAVIKAGNLHYDIIFMDLHMPEMNGFEATRALRASPHSSKVPIVALTANAMVEDRDRCIAAGMDDFIGKPVRPEALIRALARWTKVALPIKANRESPLAEASEMPEVIEGLDPGIEWQQMLGPQRYQSVLDSFVSDQAHVPEAIRDALSRHDVEKAERLAHTLSGLAAMIGAIEIKRLVNALAMAIRTTGGSQEFCEPIVVQLEFELRRQMDAIRSVVRAAPGDVAP